MTDQATFNSAEPEKNAGDILARLYREIGISAVAAALQALAPKADAIVMAQEEMLGHPRGRDGRAA